MKIAFLGDVMLGRLVNRELKTRHPRYPWGDTLAVLEEADARVCNLECVISDRGEPWGLTPKAFHFRTDAKNVKVLETARIDCVSLANNHILDFEHTAMFDTMKVLDNAGIKRAGCGASLEEASRPAVFIVKGKRIGFISFTDNEPGWEAGPGRPGVFYLPIDLEDERAKNLFSLVRETKKAVDLLVVSAHWGPNWGYTPVPEHPPFARALIDEGADIIFGHSCHVFQGIELYRGRPIIYSAGDFVDDYAVDEVERNDESFIFAVTVNGRPEALHLYPTVIGEFQANLARGMRRRVISEKMMELCRGLGTETGWDGKAGRVDISIK